MPFRHHADVIGSLLRPRYLWEARAAGQAGQISAAEFKRIEDRACGEDPGGDWDWHPPVTITGKIRARRQITLEEFAYSRVVPGTVHGRLRRSLGDVHRRRGDHPR